MPVCASHVSVLVYSDLFFPGSLEREPITNTVLIVVAFSKIIDKKEWHFGYSSAINDAINSAIETYPKID